MKKYILFAFLFSFVTLAFLSCHSKDDNGIPGLLERKSDMGSPEELANIKTSYNKAVDILKDNPDDLKQYLTLANVFITEGRITGNGSYYSNAAMKMINKVVADGKTNKDLMFEAYSLESTVLLNMHQFKDALAAAQQGVALFDYNAAIYGALVDANVELGHYDEAVKDCDKMISIRPDLRSYSRASYIRQIYGRNEGAIVAMQMAVEAGAPGLESTEWARVALGNLYLNIGKLDSAEFFYRTSLMHRPGYPVANIGIAKVACARKNYDTALAYTKNAIAVVSDAAYVSYLADIYEMKGDSKKAKEVRDDVVDLLEKAQKDEPSDVAVKHNVSREMATAYMNDGNLDKALQYAQTDLSMRPDNIDANELIAWIYYLKGDHANAKAHADKMLATNTKNANTLYKAGVIYKAAGDTAKSNQMIGAVQSISPYIDQRLINETKHT